MRYKKNKMKLLPVLIVAGSLFLTGCVTTSDRPTITACPTYPIAGKAVANELALLNQNDFPNLIEWIGRIDKLAEQLELCK